MTETTKRPRLVVKESNLSKDDLFFVVEQKTNARFAECYKFGDALEIAKSINQARGWIR